MAGQVFRPWLRDHHGLRESIDLTGGAHENAKGDSVLAADPQLGRGASDVVVQAAAENTVGTFSTKALNILDGAFVWPRFPGWL